MKRWALQCLVGGIAITAVAADGISGSADELISAIRKMDSEAVKALVSDDVRAVVLVDKFSVNPVVLAASKGDVGSVAALVSAGFDVNARDCNGDSALHVAFWKNDVTMVKWLLQNEADIFAVNGTHYTPLHVGMNRGAKEAVEEILKHAKRTGLLDKLLLLEECFARTFPLEEVYGSDPTAYIREIRTILRDKGIRK